MSQRLEELSDKVRNGEPIGFTEALEVISYQEHLRENRKKNKWYNRLLKTLTFNTKEK
jgi:hypothetical protein